MSEHEIKPIILGLDDIQANALFAWQQGLLYELDDNGLVALESVMDMAKEKNLSNYELRQVPIDKGWVEDLLLKLASTKNPKLKK